MTWSFDQIDSLFEKMRHDEKVARDTWNKEFPPNIEVYVDDRAETGLEKPTQYGVWKVDDGFYMIPKSKNGYHPERRISIPNEVAEAIRGLR